MGIKELYKVIEELAPDTMYTSSFEKLCGYSVAADISIFLHKYIKSAGPVYWIDLFIKLLCLLKMNGTKTICIFDGPNPPIEKKQEQQERREAVEKTRTKLRLARTLLETIENDYISSPNGGGGIPKGKMKGKSPANDTILLNQLKSVLDPSKNGKKSKKQLHTNYKDAYDVRSSLNIRIEILEKQTTPISADFAQKAKDIITHMGIAYYQADGEAEGLCSSLCFYGIVDAVLSEDTDVLAYNAPMLFSKIDLQTNTFRVTKLDDVLDKMNYTHFEFRDLCILLKCDYNKKIEVKALVPRDPKKPLPKKITKLKPKNVGKVGAVLLSQEYRVFENMSDVIIDMEESTKYKRIREIFTIDKNIKNIVLPFNEPLNIPAIKKFLKENNSNVQLEYIQSCWEPVKIVFEE
jgi:5'-3' exonuclease